MSVQVFSAPVDCGSWARLHFPPTKIEPVTSQKEQEVSCPQKLFYGGGDVANLGGEVWAERQRADGLPGSNGPQKGGPVCSRLQHDALEPLWLQRKGPWLSGVVMY